MAQPSTSGAFIRGADMELIQHYDAGRFGHPRIDANTEGVRILDLIRSKEKGPDALPLSPAAQSVIEALERLGDRLKLYQATGTSWAAPINLTRPVSIVTSQRLETYDEAVMRQRERQMMTGYALSDWRVVNPRSLKRVQSREARQVAWLATMRERLVGASNRKGLDDPELVRLVIRRDIANDLFGCGPVLSWWEEQPAPFPLTGPGLYPPPELQGIRPHDGVTWGEQLTQEARPRAVVRVADLVQFVADQSGLRAVRPVAAGVLDAMAGSAPELFLLNQGDMAAAIEPGKVWRRRYLSGAEHRREWQQFLDESRSVVTFVSAGPTTELAEAEARGLSIKDQDRAMGGVYCQDDWPELPALTGAAGALEWARVQWVERARTFADLDAGDLGRLAVPLAWAVAKFRRPVPQAEPDQSTEPRQAIGPLPLAIVAELPVKRSATDRAEREQYARSKFKPAKDLAEIWQPQHFAELLYQVEYLTARGAGKLNSDAAHAVIGSIWGVSENTVKTYASKARTLRTDGQLPARRA